MKKIILVLSIFALVSSCNESGKKSEPRDAGIDSSMGRETNPLAKKTDSSHSWWADTSKYGQVVEGENYIFIAKNNQNQTPFSAPYWRSIPPNEAIANLKEYEMVTRALKGKRTFSVTLNSDALFDYLATHGGPENLSGIRIYAGAYPSSHSTYPGQFTAFVVAINKTGDEVYTYSGNGMIQNLGSLCPTICPKDDRNSIYYKAGSFEN